MEPVSLALFVLALIGCIWTTVYAFFEYRTERLEELQATVQRVVQEEVMHQYVCPVLRDKIRLWESSTLRQRGSSLRDCPRKLFVSARRAMLLGNQEVVTYVNLCEDAMRRRRACLPRHALHEMVSDACCDYMWHPTPLDDLWDFLHRIYAE